MTLPLAPPLARALAVRRPALARTLTVVGLIAYNWWLPVAVRGGLLTTPNELFSDLEVGGRPRAAALPWLDVAAGLILLAALLLHGTAAAGVRRRASWRLLVVFAAAGVLGGAFPYVCAEGLSAACRSAEWRLQLPWRH